MNLRSEHTALLFSGAHWRAVTALILLCIALFLPGFAAVPPLDRDEPRFAQATKQMLETGDYVSIRFQNENRFKKPVGIYWLQAASVAAGRAAGIPDALRQIWLYRVPSLLGAILGVLLTYWTALAFLPRRSALTAAALMACTVIIGVEARFAKTDAVLLATVMLSVGALARTWFAYTDPRTVARPGMGTAVLFWIAMGIGILIKGPITPMIALFIALVLSVRERSGRWLLVLRPWLGLAIVAVIVLPWLIAIVMKSGSGFFEEAIGKDMLGKIGGGQERHGAPPGTYLGIFWATAWPLAPFVALAIPFLRREWRDDAIMFLLAWVVPAWILFEAVPTKLPHYVMPLYPALAIAVAIAIQRGALDCRHRWQKAVALLVGLIPVGLLIGAPIAGWIFGRSIPWLALPFLAVAAGLAVMAILALWRDEARPAIPPAIGAALCVSVGAFQFGVPALGPFTLSERLAQAAYGAGCTDPRLATVGYREPSLVFLTETGLAMPVTGADGARFIGGSGCRVVLVAKQQEDAFRSELLTIGVQAELTGRVSGFNLNSGRILDMGVWLKR